MDLGSLELQIFVSLTVVLGGAFVALVCDYLKGNNEQLREHNIELRVRKEEQERRLLLDPVGTIGQYAPIAKAAAQPQAAPARTVAPHEAMQSFASPAALSEADARASTLYARGGEARLEEADVPPISEHRRRGKRSTRKEGRPAQGNGASYADWVRPEVIARVARKAETATSYSNDIRDELESIRNEASLAPVAETPVTFSAPVVPEVALPPSPPASETEEFEPAEPRMTPEEASRLQREIERVSQLERQSVTPAPGTILRPLTVPSLKLEEEIQRVAETSLPPREVVSIWNSPLLDEVIAASATRHRSVPETVPAPSTVELLAIEPAAPIIVDLSPALEVPSPIVAETVEPVALAEVVEEVVAPEEIPQAAYVMELEPEPVAEVVHETFEPFSIAFAPESSPLPFATPEPTATLELLQELPEATFEPVSVVVADSEIELAPVTAVDVQTVDSLAQSAPILEEISAYVAQADPAPVLVDASFLTTEVVSEVEVELLPPAVTLVPEVESLVPLAPVMEEISAYVAQADPVPVLVDASFLTTEVVSEVEVELLPPAVTLVPEGESLVQLAPVMEESLPFVAQADPIPSVAVLPFAEAEVVREAELELTPLGASHIPEPETTVLPPPLVTESVEYAVEAEMASGNVEVPIAWLDSQETPPTASEPAPAEGILWYYALGPHHSRLAGMGISPEVDYLQTLPVIEKPEAHFALSDKGALAFQEDIQAETAGSLVEELELRSDLPDLLPVYAELTWEPPIVADPPALLQEEKAPLEVAAIPVPPPFWATTAAVTPEPAPVTTTSELIDISTLRQPEVEPEVPVAPVSNYPDLLLPTGMHDNSTWARLLSLPNPMTGILFVISLQSSDSSAAVGKSHNSPVAENGPAIERLMASFVREGDFGTKVADNEWIFIYNHDVTGFNQRRVGMISEKLWDFQLRHLGMANVSFKWGAVDVKSEPVGEAAQAARDRMNQTRRTRKLPAGDHALPRRVVNG